MGYKANSLQRIKAHLPERFDTDSGTELYQQLEELEESAISNCRREMENGLRFTLDRFLGLYVEVPYDSPLSTPSLRRGINYKALENRNPDEIWQKLQTEEGHRELSEIATQFERRIKQIISHPNQLQRGPIKKIEKIRTEIFSRWKKYGIFEDVTEDHIIYIRDIIRGRIISPNIKEVEENLASLFSNDTALQTISCFNGYRGLFPNRRHKDIPRPYIACNLALQATPQMPYELQIMTSRANLVGKITHKGLLVDNPIPNDVQNDIETLAWASHILDYEEYLSD